LLPLLLLDLQCGYVRFLSQCSKGADPMIKLMKNILIIAIVLTGGMLVFASTRLIINSFEHDVCQITLNAPELFQPGQMVLLDASESSVSYMSWGILPKTNNFRIIDNGRKAIFTGNGDKKCYTIIISGYLNGKLVQYFHILTLGYDSNIAVSDLQEKIINWLPMDRTHDEMIKLVQSFNSIARIIENGTLTTTDEIVEATAWSTTDALGDSIDKWKPFLRNLQEYLEASPPNDHAITWREIARALEAADGAA